MKYLDQKRLLYIGRHCHLYFKLMLYICNIRAMVCKIREGKDIKINDFPCFVIGCKYGAIWALGHSKQCHKKLRYHHSHCTSISSALCSAQKNIVSHTKTKERLYWGSCAEDYAASHVLKQFAKKYPRKNLPALKNLDFTLPIRPRTLETHPMCTVCKILFEEKYLCFDNEWVNTFFTNNKL